MKIFGNFFYDIMIRGRGINMKILRVILIITLVVIYLIVGFIGEALYENYTLKDKEAFLTIKEGAYSPLYLDEKQKIILFVSDFTYNQSDIAECEITINGSTNSTEFDCDSPILHKAMWFSISIELDGIYYYLDDMNDDVLIINDSLAIGQKTLPEGTYRVKIDTETRSGYANVATLLHSASIENIGKIAIGLLLLPGLVIILVIVVVIYVVIKKKNKSVPKEIEKINTTSSKRRYANILKDYDKDEDGYFDF